MGGYRQYEIAFLFYNLLENEQVWDILHHMSQTIAPSTGTLRVLFLVAAAFMVPFVMEGAAINVNSICEVGDCASPDVLSVGGSTVFNDEFVFTFADGDKYLVFGVVNASEPVLNETIFGVVGGVEYIGNSGGSSPSVGTDTLVIDFLQGYTSTLTGGSFPQGGGVSPPMGGGIADGSSFEEQNFFDGQSLPALGPYTVGGSPEAFSTTSLSGTHRSVTV